MSSLVKDNNNITLTRGDTFIAKVNVWTKDDDPFELSVGDEIRFALKADYDDEEVLIYKSIPINTMILRLDPEDTKDLEFGTYVYDIQVTFANGIVDTVIAKRQFTIAEEVE